MHHMPVRVPNELQKLRQLKSFESSQLSIQLELKQRERKVAVAQTRRTSGTSFWWRASFWFPVARPGTGGPLQPQGNGVRVAAMQAHFAVKKACFQTVWSMRGYWNRPLEAGDEFARASGTGMPRSFFDTRDGLDKQCCLEHPAMSNEARARRRAKAAALRARRSCRRVTMLVSQAVTSGLQWSKPPGERICIRSGSKSRLRHFASLAFYLAF